MKETIRRMAAILITVCMLVSCMPFAAFADNEPATPTDLAPVEEEKQEESGEEDPVEGEAQEEPGKEEPAEEEAGEEPGEEEPAEEEAQEEPGKEEPAEDETTGDGPAGEGGNEEGEGTEGNQTELPELHYGKNGLRGTLKAGQEYKAVLRPEYSWNILVTLELIPRAGQTATGTGVQMRFDGDKKELTQIENEDPESTGITLQFGVYAAKEKEHTISITVPFDTDFILTAVKRPKQETEQENEEETGDSEETTEPGSGDETEGGEDGEELSGATGKEGNGIPVTGEEPGDGEETGDSNEKPAGVTEEEAGETDGDGEPQVPADGEEPENGEDGEEPADVTGEEETEKPEENKEPEEEPEEPAADPVKKEPATPTDLAPLEEETQAQPVNEGTKAGDTKKTEDNSTEKPEEETEEPVVLPTDEELLALGYYGIQVVMIDGADIFDSMEEGAEPVAHIDAGEVLWIKPTEDDAWAEIYRADEEAPAQYIRWDDVMINQRPETEEEEEEELPARSLEITSTLSGMLSVPVGTPVVMTAELINFREEDICTFQWQYLDEETETYIDIDGANELTYSYEITRENFFYTWRLVVLIANAG